MSKIIKISFMATSNEARIKKTEFLINKETAKTYKVNSETENAIVKKSEINEIKPSYYYDTYALYARKAWVSEDEVDNIISKLKRTALAHFVKASESSNRAIAHLKDN